jgi:hypothetical protein
VRRRQSADLAAVASTLPESLRTYRPDEWPAPEPSDDDRDFDAAAVAMNSRTVKPGEYRALIACRRSRQAFNAARVDWCRANGMTDDHGNVDWRQFGPLIRTQENKATSQGVTA